MADTLIAALISGAFTIIGVLIANSRMMAIQNERIEQSKLDIEKLDEKQTKLSGDVQVLQTTVASHTTEIKNITKKVDTMEQRLLK